jgi:S1-C subfamily serine protease
MCSRSGPSVWILAVVAAGVLPNAPAIANDNAIASYEPAEERAAGDPHLHSLDEYVHGGVIEVAPLGLQLREDQRELKSGVAAKGLLIVAVAKGSPAANAGLEALQEAPKQVLRGLAVAGSMAFPPAIILLPAFESLPIGRDGDLIIAVDGSRVTNVVDFEDDIRDAQQGEILYLTVVRAGARLQLQVFIPPVGHSRDGQ